MEVNLYCEQDDDPCRNAPVLRGYAEQVTRNEDRAREEAAHVIPGEIACGRCIANPRVNFCGAQLLPPVVPEHPDIEAEMCVPRVEDIQGFTPTVDGTMPFGE